MEVRNFKQYLPPLFEGGYKNNRKYIHAVICVYLLTIIQPEYKQITYHEFVTNFQKYVEVTNSEDNPCLFYQSGKQQGNLKIPNENTFARTWVPCYNVHKLFEDFKSKVAVHIAQTTLRDSIFDVPNFIEKDKETFDNSHELQQRLFKDTDTYDSKKPYPIKATQETKNAAKTSIKESVEMVQDYLDTINQQNNQGHVYSPNHDRIIDRYRALEDSWEED